MARKTAKDYSKEYTTLLEKTIALQARIKNRAEELCKKFPNAPIGWGATGRELEKSFKHLSTREYLDIIRTIELYNEEKANIKQGKLF